MRIQFGKFGSVVLVAVILTALLGVEANSARNRTLVLQIDLGNEIFNAGFTRELDKGVRTYQEWGLLNARGEPVGLYRFHAVSTQPVEADVPAWYGNESFEIFGEGVIEGISQADGAIGLFPVGAIIGGTGRFSGASGEYSATDFSNYTFTFNRAH